MNSPKNPTPIRGTLALVGAGPGDPELLTVGAYKALLRADVVLYDRLVSDEIVNLAPEHAEKIYAGKSIGKQAEVQEAIFEILVRALNSGKFVVRLKGGDPMVFGRGIEEWLFASELECKVEVYPGISSSIAAPELVGIPVTARGCAEGFAVVTGHRADPRTVNWERYTDVETLVILMGVKNRQAIASELIAAGRNPLEPCAFIENSSRSNQRILRSTLKTISEGNTHVISPAVWVSGNVVNFYDVLNQKIDSLSDPVPESQFQESHL